MIAEMLVPHPDGTVRLNEYDVAAQHVYHIFLSEGSERETDIYRLGAKGSDFVSRSYRRGSPRFVRRAMRLTEGDYRQLYDLKFKSSECPDTIEVAGRVVGVNVETSPGIVRIPLPNPVSERALGYYDARILLRDPNQRLEKWNNYNKDRVFLYAGNVEKRELRVVLRFR